MREKVWYFRGNGVRRREGNVKLGDTITPQIEHIFKNGQCHALAAALHEILGWRIHACYDREGMREWINHFVVIPPLGGNADIHGIRCIDYRTKRASYRKIIHRKYHGFLPPAMTFARHYAPMIAAEILKQEEAMRNGKPKPKWTLCSEGYLD